MHIKVSLKAIRRYEDQFVKYDDIPVGLIDSIVGNYEYKDLIEKLWIEEFDYTHAQDMNDYLIKDYDRNKYNNEINQEYNFNFDSNSEEQKKLLMTEKEIKVILLWKASNLSLNSIGLKAGFQLREDCIIYFSKKKGFSSN